MSPINIVLDTDGVLACHWVRSNIKYAYFFKQKGAIVSALQTHYIFPGVIEFIQLLNQTKEIKISFFSAAKKQRNELFVKELFRLSLKNKEIKNDVCILSEEDLTDTIESECVKKRELYNLVWGPKCKDLLSIIKDKELLKNSVLIDDSHASIAPTQEKSLLYVRNTSYFSDLKDKESYDENGYKPLQCYIEQPTNDFEYVEKGKLIVIIQEKNSYEVCFINKETYEFVKKEISDTELISKLKAYDTNSDLIEDKELIELIQKFVSSFNGKTHKICRSANRIYYIVGLLFTALKESKQKTLPITEVLFQLQYKNKTYEDGYELNSSWKNDNYYLYGLKKLKKINKNLTFTTPKNYTDLIKSPISEEVRLELQEAIKNQVL